jgi:AcrR family transcriptional regulator
MSRIKKKLTRAEKSELTRRNLLAAAVEVVGEQGYGDASVTNITSRAQIAQGTFYNYFESKQDILDQLLPELGEVLLEYLRERVGSATYLEREERSLRAYFDFIRERPEFYRILLEAQVYAPESYARHAENLTRNYIVALRKNQANGYLRSYAEDEFEALAVILLGARVQLMGHYCFRQGRMCGIPEQVIGTFMKFLEAGFGEAGGPSRRPAPTRWYEGTVLATSASGVDIRYQVATNGSSARPDADDALQELITDLLGQGRAVICAPGQRVKSCNSHLSSKEIPDLVHAALRVESKLDTEVLVSFALADSHEAGARRLATGQAILA